MGLDISAYSGIKKLDARMNGDGEAIDTKTGVLLPQDGMWFTAWVNPVFPGRAGDIESGAVYSYENCTCFSIGYARHAGWREKLAEISGYPLAEQVHYGRVEKCYLAGALSGECGPFYELINFSDCEGVIGTGVSEKLAKDLAEFKGRAMGVSEGFYDLYLKWKAAFEMASNNGCVRFH
ncbi:hypothetical protein [Pantoea sp. BAV 3049]|uniref:hypothetical protein n=1 Tax=Pantoea sp. BAV 3049 TaxID=2654188 RepID=UPI00131AC9EB|nr:hypothetical protein [Pantoea sp. BAV 3049]